jgi:hypothetical protein
VLTQILLRKESKQPHFDLKIKIKINALFTRVLSLVKQVVGQPGFLTSFGLINPLFFSLKPGLI